MMDTQPLSGTPAGRWEELASCMLSLEALSFEMISCPAEELRGRMERRAALITRVEVLRAACAEEEPSDGRQDARVAAAQDTARAAACRLQDVDRQVVARMKRAQQDILKKLRTVGKSAGAQASRFYQAQSPAKRSFFSGNV